MLPLGKGCSQTLLSLTRICENGKAVKGKKGQKEQKEQKGRLVRLVRLVRLGI